HGEGVDRTFRVMLRLCVRHEVAVVRDAVRWPDRILPKVAHPPIERAATNGRQGVRVAERNAQVLTDADRADVDVTIKDLVPLRPISRKVCIGAAGRVDGATRVEGAIAVVLEDSLVDRV